ncbi:hypothetical protein CHARACLAT_020658 [Characodon lateralis]|uniref:Secreted protein n=1 Tax=Characodon lateralis TaxID=208331 RepID=A0ABU7CZC5_9TELE|nr:hypothetical protein [Characodon lateralis]
MVFVALLLRGQSRCCQILVSGSASVARHVRGATAWVRWSDDLFTRASDRTDAAINHGSETGIISIPSQSLQRQGQASDPGSKYFPKAY